MAFTGPTQHIAALFSVVTITLVTYTGTNPSVRERQFHPSDHVVLNGVVERLERRIEQSDLAPLILPVRVEDIDRASYPLPREHAKELALAPKAWQSVKSRLFGGPRERRPLRNQVERKDANV